MARKRYSAAQIIGHLRQAEILISEGKTIGETALDCVSANRPTTVVAVHTAAWKWINPGA